MKKVITTALGALVIVIVVVAIFRLGVALEEMQRPGADHWVYHPVWDKIEEGHMPEILASCPDHQLLSHVEASKQPILRFDDMPGWNVACTGAITYRVAPGAGERHDHVINVKVWRPYEQGIVSGSSWNATTVMDYRITTSGKIIDKKPWFARADYWWYFHRNPPPEAEANTD